MEMNFFTVLDAEKFKIKVLARLVAAEVSLPGLQMATHSLCPHMAERERASQLSGVTF